MRAAPFPDSLVVVYSNDGGEVRQRHKLGFDMTGRRKVLVSQLLSWTCVLLTGMERGEVSFQPTVEEASVPKQFQLEPATFAYDWKG